MFKLILILFIVFFTFLQICAGSYAYHTWSRDDGRAETGDGVEGDTLSKVIVTNFMIPMKELFSNLYTNFIEVYRCVGETVDHIGDKVQPTQGPSFYLEKALNLVGLAPEQPSIYPSCSYYSFVVVVICLVTLFSLVFATKKLVDYVTDAEEETIIPHILGDFSDSNKRPCCQDCDKEN